MQGIVINVSNRGTSHGRLIREFNVNPFDALDFMEEDKNENRDDIDRCIYIVTDEPNKLALLKSMRLFNSYQSG
jgi:hypothetical protein